ncbi:MAG: hypothetical protein K0R17_180 [Rariglobus sp.]|jgi:hypothetical protein|nr:hypothetical protein [Rariglobus sp.]
MSPYSHWRQQARRLLEPLAALMQPGRAALPVTGRPSDHDAQADRLESFARPLLLAALYLQSEPEPDDPAAAAFRARTAAWFRAGLVLGADPHSSEAWGPDASFHQHHVEMGLMAIALQLAPRQLWEPLATGERECVAAWFATARGGGIVNNNHLFMSVHILEFLRSAGREHRTDRAVVTAHLDQLETMHRGGGWFEDGINQAFDHYNAYAFHFYGLLWSHLHGTREPSRAARWRGWARSFLADYQHLFAASGEHPAFGRSIAYRFNASAPFGLAALVDCADLPPGRLRRLCTRNLDFFLSKPITNAQGCLAPGFTDVWPDIVEPYSCAASPYWCAKGFTPLLLPPDHPFWTAAEAPLPSEAPNGFVRVMRVPGLVARGLPDGEVELLNAGSMVSITQLRYGPWKWSKLAYRTGTGFCYAFPEASAWSPDGALLQTVDDGRVFGRHSTVAIELADDHLGFVCNLGLKTGQVNTSVETFVFWREGWLFQIHRYDARQPVVLRLGGFSLPLAEEDVRLDPSEDPIAAWSPDGRGTALQWLGGTPAEPAWDNRLSAEERRRHVLAPFHATPVFQTPRHSGPGWIAALSWTGRDRAAAQPWRLLEASGEGRWQLEHPDLGAWEIEHWALPAPANACAAPFR